jgi:flagellar basal-body rod modification protein FlgD
LAIDGVSDFIQSNAIKENVSKNNSELSMDDFFQLMVAQLKNQDMFSPTDNSEFMSQMTQFSMVNALMDMSELSSVAYSTSLIGKQAEVAYISGGQMGTASGVIDAVNLFNGKAEVVIGGEAYELSNIMTVNEPPKSGATSYLNLPLIENSGLIGRMATVMHSLETGNIETISGKITSIRMVDDQLYCVIDGRAFPAREITSLSEAGANVAIQPESAEKPTGGDEAKNGAEAVEAAAGAALEADGGETGQDAGATEDEPRGEADV